MPKLDKGYLYALPPAVLLGYAAYVQYARPGSIPAFIIAAAIMGVAVGVAGRWLKFASWPGYVLAALGALLLGGWMMDRAALPALAKAGKLLTPADITGVRHALVFLPPVTIGALAAAYAIRAREGALLPPLGRRVKKSPLDIKIGGRVIPLKDRYLHTFVIGSTGTGKTSCALKPMIWQDLNSIKRGEKLGVTVVDPKGDLAADVADMCAHLGVPVIYLNPLNPASSCFNPMVGKAEAVKTIMQTVLRGMFGRQEAFFRYAQEEALTNTIYVLKELRGDDVTIADMLEFLRKPALMQATVEELERRAGPSVHTEFFRYDVLGDNKDKMNQFTLGLRLQLGQITGNALVNRVLSGRESIDLNRHLAEGGVLVVNTALGELGVLGDAFGQFFIMHLQEAVFHRPGNESTRIPHFLYIDEFSRYANPQFEPLLSMGRSYRCGAVLALQSTFQMKLDGDPEFRRKVMSNCRNKIVFNLEEYEDAKYFAQEFGMEERVEKDRTYSRDQTLLMPTRWSGIRESRKDKNLFTYTDLMKLPNFHAVIKTVYDNQPQRPELAELHFCPYNPKKTARKVVGGLDIEVPPVEPRLEVEYNKEREEGCFFD